MPEKVEPIPGWGGFYQPRYTPIPDDLFDIVMPYLSEVELRVLLYIMRRTFGFKKESDNISLNQLTDGIVRADGERVDNGAGVSESGALQAIKRLEARGVIVIKRNRGADGRLLTSTYSLRMSGDPTLQDEVGYPRIKGRATSPATEALPHSAGIQETDVQETVNKIQRDESNHFSQFVMAVADDFSRELGDAEHASANMSQANRLWRDSGLDEQEFVARMQEARRRTRQAQGGQGSGAITNKAAYFFQTLRALLTEGRTDE